MARIPVYTQRSALGGIPNVVPFEPKQTGSLLQSAGQTLDNVAQEQLRQEQLVKQKQSQDGIAWSADALAQAKLDLNQKYIDMQQSAAPGAPNFRGDFEKQFDQYVFDAGKKAPNPVGAQFFNRRMIEFKADMITQAMNFEAGARIEKRVTDIGSSIDKARNLVSDNPAMFASSLGDITASIEGVGLPDKQRVALLQDARHGLSFSAVTAQINRNPSVALKQIQSGAWDNYLDPDNRISLERSAAAEVKAQAREAQIARQTDINVKFADAITTAQMTGAQDLLSPSDIIAAYPGAQGQKMVAQLRTATLAGSDSKAILSQPMTKDAEYLHILDPQPGIGATESSLRYENAVKLINQKHQALLEDGASYVDQNVPMVKAAWDAVDANTDQTKAPALVSRALAITKEAQSQFGVPEAYVRVMPARIAADVAQQISRAGPSDVGKIIDSTIAHYGSDGLREIIAAGAPPSTKQLAFANSPSQAMWRHKLADALKIRPEDMKTRLQAIGVKQDDFDKKISEAISPMTQTATGAAGMEIFDAVKRVALLNVANGMPADAAIADAFSPYEQQYQFAGSYRVPRAFNVEKVQDGLGGVINHIAELDVEGPVLETDPDFIRNDPEARKKRLVDSIRLGNYQWRVEPNETGVGLMVGSFPVLWKDGTKFIVPFSDAEALKWGHTPSRVHPKGQ